MQVWIAKQQVHSFPFVEFLNQPIADSFCFPVSDNKLPENSSVFEIAHGTHVCASEVYSRSLPYLSLLKARTHRATKLAPYPSGLRAKTSPPLQ